MPRNTKRPPPRRRRKFKKKSRAPATKAYVNKQLAKQRSTREIKTLEQPVHTDALVHSAADTTHTMKNGLVLYPVLFNAHTPLLTQGSGSSNILGDWIQPRYMLQRFTVNWASLTHVADLMNGLELRCRYGFIKNTGHKHQASTATSYAVWQAAINDMVMKELQHSGLDDDYTTYSTRNRAIQIEGDFMVRPNLNQSPNNGFKSGTGVTTNFAPPKNFEIKWHTKKLFPRFKQRMTLAHNGYVMNNTYVPFVYFSSANITAALGSLNIINSSKFYYTDP